MTKPLFHKIRENLRKTVSNNVTGELPYYGCNAPTDIATLLQCVDLMQEALEIAIGEFREQDLYPENRWAVKAVFGTLAAVRALSEQGDGVKNGKI